MILDNSVSNDTYIPSNKENQIEVAFELAAKEIKASFPNCKINFLKRIERSDQLNIFKQVEKIKLNLKPDSTIIIGLIHSSEAILAAKAFEKTSFQVLSSGATTEKLNDLNPNFFTLSNPVSTFVDQIENFVKLKKSKFILSLSPGSSSYAKEFSQALKLAISKSSMQFEEYEFNPSNIENDLYKIISKINKADIIYAPGFIQQSLAAVSYINKISPSKIIIGTPNWGRSIPDLVNFYQKLKITSSNIYFPVSWSIGETKNSTSFETKFKNKINEQPMGTSVYTYDAAIIAGNYLCNVEKVEPITFSNFLTKLKFTNNTVRKYQKLDHGHMKSNITMVKFNGTNILAPIIDKVENH